MSSAQFGFALLAALSLGGIAWSVLEPLRGGARTRAAVAGALGALALAAALYLAVGSPAAIEAPRTAAADPAEEMALAVSARLAAQPDDAAGWRMLGGVRSMQGRYPEAATAFARARSLSGDSDVRALVGYAEARVLEDPSRLTEVAPLFARALELAPDDQKSLWYAGHAAKAAGDLARAETLWRRLLQTELPPALRSAVLEQLGSGAIVAEPGGTGASAAGAVGEAALLEVEVMIAPALAARVAPGTPLFIFVRAPGVPAPVLVKRIAAPAFPQRIAFTAADRLGAPVELGAGFTVGARLSSQGTAARASGDLEGSAPVVPGALAKVMLDSIVP